MTVPDTRAERDERTVCKHRPLLALKAGRQWRIALLAASLLACAGMSGTAWAIPPNTPFTNTVSADYSVAGTVYSAGASTTLVTDPASGNSTPYGAELDPTSIDENSSGLVGSLTALDLDPGDSHVFSTSDPRFEIAGNELRFAPGFSPDFESLSSMIVDVLVTDSAGASRLVSLVIGINDVNEVPTALALSSTGFTAATPGAAVGTLTVADPDSGDSHSFTVDDPRFEVVGTTLKLLDSESLPLGTSVIVTVTATDSGGLSYAQTFTLTATPPAGGAPGDSTLVLLQAAPGNPSANPTSLGIAQCDAGAGFSDLPAPVTFSGSTLLIPGTVDLSLGSLFKSGDPLFIDVMDSDANLDDTLIDFVEVLVTTADGDSERLRLAETGPMTARFVGYLQILQGPTLAGDCALGGSVDNRLTISYTDALNPADRTLVSGVINPLSRVFYSATGQVIDGAAIELLNAATGAAASVGAELPGVAFPARVSSGGTAFDGQGNTYDFPAGTYRFPAVAAGGYRLQVTPPNRFRFPSQIADGALQALPGAPYRLSAGSRGAIFTVPVGPAIGVDIPLDLAPLVPTDAVLELLALAPGNGAAQSTYVAQAQCFNGSTFVPSPAPIDRLGASIAVPGSQPLLNAGRFNRGDVIFLRLVEPDQDLDPFAPDTVEVRITASDGDQERVRLEETGASTGIFSGYLQTSTGVAASSDCRLTAAAGSSANVSYTDPDDATDAIAFTARLDPGFTVFSSRDGAPLDGVIVTLIDSVTGAPAANRTFAADGVTPFPTSVTSGGSVTDAAGGTITYAPGSFYFPFLLPGTYELQVQAPVDFLFPSVRDDAELVALPGGPYVIGAGSRGGAFTVAAGQSFEFDLPLDPLTVDVFVTKQASRDVVSIGDLLQYQVLVQDADAGIQTPFLVIDQLPRGFRYVSGSAQINASRAPDPMVSNDGSELHFEDVAFESGTAEVKYVVEVTVAAALGRARNLATASGSAIASANTAFADVTVREDLLQSKAILIGQVFDGPCGETQAPKGLEGVRIWLEDGTYVVTDAEGKYHIEGIEPGTHVVQVDEATLPGSHELIACEKNSRFAGSARSQFIDVAAGSLWRADFYAQSKAPIESQVRSQLFSKLRGDTVMQRLVIAGGTVPIDNLTAVVMLPEGARYVPGSLRIDDAVAADPAGADSGAITIRLGARTGAFETHVVFGSAVDASVETLTTKAMLMFETAADGRQKSPVLVTDVAINWPDSLVEPNGEALQGNRESVRATVYEPSQGDLAARSEPVSVRVSAQQLDERPVFRIPEVDDDRAPAFDRAWLLAETVGNQLVWPLPDYNPRMPLISVVAKHEAGLRPQVLINGALVSPLNFVGTTVDRARGLAVSRWDNVPIIESDNSVEVWLEPLDGDATPAAPSDRVQMRTTVHFGTAPVRAEFVPGLSQLTADGVNSPVIAVRFFDRAGRPARPGLTGEFSVAPPYQIRNPERQFVESIGSQSQSLERYLVRVDGVAYVELEPTTVTGEVQLDFAFDAVRRDLVRARLKPGARDWILIGLAEGVLGHNDVSGNLQGLDAGGVEADSFTEGRIAFYTKGVVKGQWLLTAAYDTDKDTDAQLRQQIDPNRFYTLYGDGAQQRYDAESAEKLYLKVEREAFAGLFGDFETGFDEAELTKYTRALTGVQASYYGEKVQASGFASDTEYAFVFDELRGDGTSGIYRLSERNLVVNSERVRIVTRDRFQPEQIVDEVKLSRYLDYSIDYDAGTLIFKQPVFSQDEAFNKIFIEVEYEIEALGDRNLVAGGRIAYRLDDQDSRVAMTYIDDQTQGQGGNLAGADLEWHLTDSTTLRAEVARSDTDLDGSGDAYLLEVEQRSGAMAGRAYLREQDVNFGFGQQSGVERGTRRYGVEGEYQISEQVLMRAEAYQQDDLLTGGDRLVVDGEAEYRVGDTRMTGGLRTVQETTASGAGLDSDQVTLGVTQGLMDDRLRLRSDAEIGINKADNTDFPDRLIVGADYALNDQVTLIGEQEFTFGELRDTQDTRFGVKARPWNGADISSSVQRRMTENGERLFATTGLLQQWRVDDHWTVDVGTDRVQTIKRDGLADEADELLANPGIPPASGSVDDDFTAFFTGVGYRRDGWNASSRLEFHQGDQADKWNLLAGVARQLADGKVTSGSLSALFEEQADGATHNRTDLRWGLAWRPFESAWTLLNRLDLAFDELENGAFDTQSRKLVNNTNLNYKPASGGQLSLQFGLKYLVETIDNRDYDSVTALYGAEYRRDFNPRWDWGLQAAALHSIESNVLRYSAGASIGRSFFDSAWMSVGYNFAGFDDSDFTAAEYTAKGPYLKVRMKLDQGHLERFIGFVGGRTRP